MASWTLIFGSLSARRAWIEIGGLRPPDPPKTVALRKESVDRNRMEINGVSYDVVALRKESVDRNNVSANNHIRIRVALRKESVDRNINCNSNFTQNKQSLSARRAWIEIWLGIA